MKRLYMLRHAKSSWDDPALADHDRPLAPRGRKAAKRLVAHMRGEGIEPALVLCSSARRTRETLEGIRPALGDASVEIEAELYAAGADELLARLRRVPAKVPSVLLIGHNPGMEMLALRLAAPGPLRERIAEKFPTGALATLEAATGWAELDRAELVGLVVPRELE